MRSAAVIISIVLTPIKLYNNSSYSVTILNGRITFMDTILLAVQHKGNRRLLKECLDARYAVTEADALEAIDHPFDLCIVDAVALDRHEALILAYKETQAPLFAPVLLVTHRQDVGLATRNLWRMVDELIISPIEKVELWARVQSLILARRLSLQLKERDEALLRSSEERYRQLFDASPDALHVLDAAGRFLDVNQAAEKRYGYSRAEFLQMNARDLVAPDLREQVGPRLQQSLQEGGQFEWRHRRKDGSELSVEINTTPVTFNGQRAILATVRDITERKTVEAERDHLLAQTQVAYAEAEAARRQLSNILERVSDGFVALDTNWRYTYLNTKAAQMLNRQKPQDLLGKHIWTEYPEGVGQPFHKAYEKAMAEQQPIVLEDHYTPWDRWFENRIYPSPEGLSIFFTEITERKQAEIALQESQARLRLAAQAANVGLWDWDLRTNQVYYSPEWKSQIGYAEDEISNDFSEWQSRVHPDDLEQALATVQAFIQKPWPNYQYEFRFRHKDGSYRWILAQASLLRDDEGRPYRMLGCHIDITERKQTEESLKESQRRFAALIANLPGAVYRCCNDMDWTTEFISEGVFPLTGYPPSDFMKQRRHIGQLIHLDDRQRVWDEVQAALRERRPYQITYRLATAAGAEKWVWEQGSGVYDTGGSLLMLKGFVTDITERKQAEQSLQRSEQRLRDVLDGVAAFVGVMTPDGTLIEANRAAREVAELKPEDVLGKPFADAYWWSFSQESQKRLQAAIQRAAQGENARYDVDVRIAGGRFITIDFGISPIFDETGRVTYLVPWGIDITERKQAEKALQRSEQVLQLFVEYAPAAIAMFDREMRYIAASRRYLLDYDLGDQLLVGRSHYEVFPEIPDRWRNIHRRCMAGAIEKAEADPFRRASGKLDWVRWEIHPWYENTGETGGLILFSEVITERKRAEEALQRYNERLIILRQIDQDIIAARSPEEIIQPVLQGIRRLISCVWAGVALFDPATSEVVISALDSSAEAVLDTSQRAPFVRNQIIEQLEAGQVIVIPDLHLHQNSTSPEIVKQLINKGLRSNLTVPLIAQGRLIGVLSLADVTLHIFYRRASGNCRRGGQPVGRGPGPASFT
jgi:PAS domain S-box-containing protein